MVVWIYNNRCYILTDDIDCDLYGLRSGGRHLVLWNENANFVV